MTVLDENQAVSALKRGDTGALEWIIRRYAAYVGTVVYNIIGRAMSASDAEEVASDVFLALWNNAAKVNADKLKAYLGSVARNKAKNKLREIGTELHIEDDIIIIADGTPEKELLFREQQTLVRDAVASMGQPDREIFLRYYYYCQSVADIAAEMRMNASTVKTRLARGRERLKKTLNQGGYFDDLENLGLNGQRS